MNLEIFVSQHNVDYSDSPVDVPTLEQAEKTIGVNFGEELTEYLLKYGYLGYEYVELYGMNARQGLESDLVTQSLYVHKYFPVTSKLIAVENQGEGDYYLIDSEDNIYEYDTSLKQLRKAGIKFFEYILQRFESVG